MSHSKSRPKISNRPNKDETTVIVPRSKQTSSELTKSKINTKIIQIKQELDEKEIEVFEEDIPIVDLTADDSIRDIIQTRSKLTLTQSVFKICETPKQEVTESQIISNPKLFEKIRKNIKRRKSVYNPTPFTDPFKSQELPHSYNTRSKNIETQIKKEVKIEREDKSKRSRRIKIEKIDCPAQKSEIRRSLRMQAKAIKTDPPIDTSQQKTKKLMDKKRELKKESTKKSRKSSSPKSKSKMVPNPFAEEHKKRRKKKSKTQVRCPDIKMPTTPDCYSNINKVMIDTINMTLHFADKHMINDEVAVFRGEIVAKRYVENKAQYLVRWSPYDVIENEWLDEPRNKKNYKLEKHIKIKQFTPNQRMSFYRYHEPVHQINQNKRTNETHDQRIQFVKEASLDSGIMQDDQNDIEDRSESSSNADSNDSYNSSTDSRQMIHFKDHSKLVLDDNRNVLDSSKDKKLNEMKQPLPPKNNKRRMRSLEHSDSSNPIRKSRRLSVSQEFAKENWKGNSES